jgi:predicted nucleotidyltransferase
MTEYLELLHRLSSFDVQFILVGGVAGVVHGSARLTEDVDVVYQRSPENIDRLVAALDDLSPYPRGAPPGLPFLWDAETVARGLNFTLTTPLGSIDLLGEITGGGGYEDLVHDSIEITLSGRKLRCLGLKRLIEVKAAAGRPKDFEAIAELKAIQEERGSASGE